LIIPLSMTYRKQGDAIARLKVRFKSTETPLGVILEEVPLLVSRKVNPANLIIMDRSGDGAQGATAARIVEVIGVLLGDLGEAPKAASLRSQAGEDEAA
jgi:hypothetical protein